MTLRCGLEWRDRNGFYALRSEENEKEKEREREKVAIKKESGREGELKFHNDN